MKKLAEEKARSMGGLCQFRIVTGYPVLLNDEKITDKAKKAAIEFLGREKVEYLEIRMTAEDFAWYSQKIPACFYRLGTGNVSKGITAGVHTSVFDIDEAALETGMGLMAWIAFSELGS